MIGCYGLRIQSKQSGTPGVCNADFTAVKKDNNTTKMAVMIRRTFNHTLPWIRLWAG